METIKLKNSDLEVSRLCIGGCPFGGHGWGNVSEEDFVDAINCALENGINFFDTADVYGLGASERLLGKYLHNVRDKVIIGSKFGVKVGNGATTYDNSPAYINECIEGSLERLKTDYIDLYQIHYRDENTPISDVVEALQKLQEQGKIRYFGLSNIHKDNIKELEPYKNLFVSFQDEYSLACRKNEEDMNYLSDSINMTPITWGSLGQGILTGKYDKNVSFDANDRRSRDIYVNFHGDKLLKNLDIVEEMKNISGEINKTLPAIAIRFILDYLKDSVVIAGVKTRKQLESNISALGWNLDNKYIKSLSLISQ